MKNKKLLYGSLLLLGFLVCMTAGAQKQAPKTVSTITPNTQVKPANTATTVIVKKPVAGSNPNINVNTTAPNLSTTNKFTAAHSISGINPEKAQGGTEITISGQKFGINSADVRVTINGKSAIIKGISDDQIQVVVPIKAGSGPVFVKVKDQTASGGWFYYDWKATVSLFAGAFNEHSDVNGPPSIARFNHPYYLQIDRSDNMYVRGIRGGGSMISKFGDVSSAGSSPEVTALFNKPITSVTDARGNRYELGAHRGSTSIGFTGSHCIKKITPSGVTTILAGSTVYRDGGADGYGEAAVFANLQGIAIDRNGYLYVTEIDGDLMAHGDRVRMISPEGNVTTLAGGGRERIGRRGHTDGVGVDALFSGPSGIVVDSKGNLFVAETMSSVIRKITLE